MTDGEDGSFEDRTAHLLKLASKATARGLQDRLAQLGISYSYWTLFRILWREDGITVTELADRARVAKPSVVAAINSMEKDGYVERRRKEGNLKAIYIYLTKTGMELEAKLVPLALEVNEIALNGITEYQEKRLRQMLITIIRNLDTTPNPRQPPRYR